MRAAAVANALKLRVKRVFECDAICQKVAGGRQGQDKVGGFQFTETRVAAAGTVVAGIKAQIHVLETGERRVELGASPITGGRSLRD